MEINTRNQLYHSFQALHTHTLPNPVDSLDRFKMQHWFLREDNGLVYKQKKKIKKATQVIETFQGKKKIIIF